MNTELLKIIVEADEIIDQYQDYQGSLLNIKNDLSHIDQQLTERHLSDS